LVLSARQRWCLVTVATIAAAALTARLGWWQLDRAAQKTALEVALAERGRLPPLVGAAQLARTAEVAAAQHYRAVQLTGRWSAVHTVYLENRQMNGRPGFYVVTPLVLGDGSAVLVQRGWLPRDFQDRSHVAAVPTPAQELQVQGRIAPPPARLYEFAAGEAGRIRQNLDLDAFARETGLGLRPLSVLMSDAADSPAGDGLQRHWPLPSSGIAKHRGYAAQWFGLSLLILALYVWFQLLQPRRRSARA
jgi:surfeit locus 1 family protein